MAALISGGVAAEGRIVALSEHLQRHPEAAAADLYKFLHQGVFGPGHMIEDREAAARYLERELQGLDPAREGETVCESLGGDPSLLRIHLRPFLRSGLDTEQLLGAFVASANQVRGDPNDMADALDRAVAWLNAHGREALATELALLRAEHEAAGYPALHHSQQYREAYRPAYRVVLREFAERYRWCDERRP